MASLHVQMVTARLDCERAQPALRCGAPANSGYPSAVSIPEIFMLARGCRLRGFRLHVRQRIPPRPQWSPTRAMARQFIYHMSGLNKAFGPKKILENIHLSFYPDAKIGILGPNGAGKSTVLKIMAGIDKEWTGEAWLADGATVGYLPQEPELDPALNVLGNVMEGVAAKKAILDRYNELMMDYSDETAEEAAKLQDEIDSQNLWDLDSQVEMAMEALRCPPGDATIDNLSGGEKRRVALCQLLLRQPDLLLLDEPTNHLDAETTAWLEKHLRDYPGSVLIVTHDRYFLDNVTGWILELDRGRGIPYEGNYTAYLEKKAKRLAQEGREEDARQKAIAREREWISSSPKARQAKSKARFKAYDELVKAANDRRPGDAQIVIPAGERLGDRVIDAEDLSKGYGDKLLIDGLEFKLPPGGIVGVIGPNGAGKTTLFRMITGQEKPDGGQITVGDTVKLGYVDQSRDHLDPNRSVWEEISGGNDIIKLGKHEVNSRAYCSAFNFRGGDQQQKVGTLSGGQRNRVHLAKLLKDGGNVILLDEPTNDLDTETLAALEEALEAFAGCAVIISHDRMFLDRLATHILAFEGESHVEWFEGNFEDYEKDKIRRLGPDSVNPKRVTYKRLTR
jgi:ATP-binding cassette ChvD family protein